ncbi:MAG: hypothetical protein AB7G11_10540 [Phycisphaerales bacterium]
MSRLIVAGRWRWRGMVAAGMVAGVSLALSGCIFAPMLRASELKGSHDVKAKYTGLAGKSFAVVVSADRMIQADYPMLVGQITSTVGQYLADNCDASGWIEPQDVMAFQYKNPRWSVMRLDDLAKELGVERLVMVEIMEFRLHEPGNQYLWRGSATAKVGVIESDGIVNDNFVFQEQVSSQFPLNERALGPAQMSGDVVQVQLAKKLVNRISWLFYDHTEKNVESELE